jgi:hypothetical protein
MRADLEEGATPVDGLIVSAMQDGKRLAEGIRMYPAYIPSKVWHWLWFRRHILGVPERCSPSERSCHKRGVGSKWAVKEEEFPEHLQGQSYESALVEEFERDIDQFREWILESPVVTLEVDRVSYSERHSVLEAYLYSDVGAMIAKASATWS